ncbi:hypothetical protein [Propionivibrio dicarboxylicus]|uniref:SpoIIAA-like n=1 Tax=Propionivibrio dicarboxylicus TaxID=83767 RepID=A0A1G7WLZ4_9RHOO|nr:hypothetical protein [Propionivibrio dicarboxylicus]SDG72932.1 hypothetical protein SAMN05660652_00564 [Propionivibrio dicarboxylicus]
MSHELVWESDGVLVCYHGHLTIVEVAQVARLYQADERYDSLRYIVHDCRQCTGGSYSTEALLELAATDGVASRQNPDTRIAIVATHPDVVSLVQEYISTGMNRHEVRLFSAMDEARQWAMAESRSRRPWGLCL